VLAALRAQPKKRKADLDDQGPSPDPERRPVSGQTTSASPSRRLHGASVSSVEGPCSTLDNLLSRPVEQLLQKIYFDCMFNATLVFHRPSFTQAWEERRLPQHVLLAVYATATM
jgi:hypothetical protein